MRRADYSMFFRAIVLYISIKATLVPCLDLPVLVEVLLVWILVQKRLPEFFCSVDVFILGLWYRSVKWVNNVFCITQYLLLFFEGPVVVVYTTKWPCTSLILYVLYTYFCYSRSNLNSQRTDERPIIIFNTWIGEDSWLSSSWICFSIFWRTDGGCFLSGFLLWALVFYTML